MESGFKDFVLEHLRDLISDLETAQEPSNGALYEVVAHELRVQYDREQGLPMSMRLR